MESRVGFGVLEELPSLLEKSGAQRIFLVTGKSSFTDSGAEERITPLLNGYTYERFSDVSANPHLSEILDGARVAERFNPDLIIGIGGGSVLDTAKSLARLVSIPEASREAVAVGTEQSEGKPLNTIAIPTTAGTGSEATHFAVFYVNGKKHSMAHQSMLPCAALVDPSLLRSLAQPIKAATGMDALAQAIESYWSVKSTDESKVYARTALAELPRHLVSAVTHGSDEALLAVATGAHDAGKAINISFTTASHAMSYALTQQFNIPHGYAVALTLPSVMRYNALVTEADVLDPRGVGYVQQTLREIAEMLGAANPEEAAGVIEGIMTDIGLKTRLSDLGITREDIPALVEDLSADRVKNNPRRLTPADATELLIGIL